MASLKELKGRINSVKSTQKITKAKQMVAAAKLRKAQANAEAARPYATRFAAVMASLAGKVAGNDGAPKLMAGTGKDQVHLMVVANSDKGLAGAFNANIVKAALVEAKALDAAGKTVLGKYLGGGGQDGLARGLGGQIPNAGFACGAGVSAGDERKGLGTDAARALAASAFDGCLGFLAAVVLQRSGDNDGPTGQDLRQPADHDIAEINAAGAELLDELAVGGLGEPCNDRGCDDATEAFRHREVGLAGVHDRVERAELAAEPFSG